MTLRAWLRAGEPTAPEALAARIDALAAPFDAQPGDVADRCLASAEAGLRRLLREGAPTRDSALDLLAIDALVTYAFEAASHEPERLPALSRDSMRRLSAIAHEP